MLYYSGRLFHQYVVDMYCMSKWSIVDDWSFFEKNNNQGSLRTELYSGLADATVTDSTTTSTEEIGRRQTILPSSSHVESPRAMHQQLYQESMVIVSVLGRPSYFIIFTCNPHWVEITRELLLRNGGKAPPADKPDYCMHTFSCTGIINIVA